MDIRVVKVVKDFKDVGLNEDDSGYQDVKDFMDVGIKQMNQVWHQSRDIMILRMSKTSYLDIKKFRAKKLWLDLIF